MMNMMSLTFLKNVSNENKNVMSANNWWRLKAYKSGPGFQNGKNKSYNRNAQSLKTVKFNIALR